MQTIRLIIKGKVQGVFYRSSAQEIAVMLGIKGWVKNLPDKNVEIIASANTEVLEQYIEWCRKGPPRARVAEVIIENLELQEFIEFRIIR